MDGPDNRDWLPEEYSLTAHHGIIPPAVVKVKVGLALDALAGEAVVCVERAILVAVDAEGHVALFALAGSAGGAQLRAGR